MDLGGGGGGGGGAPPEELSSEAEDSGVVVELSADEAASIFAIGEMLNAPSLDPLGDSEPAPTLASLVAASGAPLRLEEDPVKGLRLVATRAIAAGETLLSESALGWCLCRSPGSDGVFTMTDQAGRVVAALPPWALLRTLRDTLTLAPQHALRAEAAYGILHQLSALGSRNHSAWLGLPSLPPGLPPAAEREEACPQAMPPRVQLLQAIAQCNAFATALPAEDSPWKRALLWPMLGRMQSVEDRERLFDEPTPFAYLSAYFPLGSLFNHSCAPSVAYTECSWEEGAPAPTVTFVALRALAAGEEATHSYIDSSLPVASRRKKLLLTYRFACACSRCQQEMGEEGEGGEDPLRQHFPHGLGPEGLAAYYARGGQYPEIGRAHV